MKSTQIMSPLRKARPSQLLPAVFSLFLHFFHKFPMFALLMRALSPPLSRPLHWNNCLSQFIYDLLLLKCFAMPHTCSSINSRCQHCIDATFTLIPISRDLSRHMEHTAHGPSRMWAYGALPLWSNTRTCKTTFAMMARSERLDPWQ